MILWKEKWHRRRRRLLLMKNSTSWPVLDHASTKEIDSLICQHQWPIKSDNCTLNRSLMDIPDPPSLTPVFVINSSRTFDFYRPQSSCESRLGWTQNSIFVIGGPYRKPKIEWCQLEDVEIVSDLESDSFDALENCCEDHATSRGDKKDADETSVHGNSPKISKREEDECYIRENSSNPLEINEYPNSNSKNDTSASYQDLQEPRYNTDFACGATASYQCFQQPKHITDIADSTPGAYSVHQQYDNVNSAVAPLSPVLNSRLVKEFGIDQDFFSYENRSKSEHWQNNTGRATASEDHSVVRFQRFSSARRNKVIVTSSKHDHDQRRSALGTYSKIGQFISDLKELSLSNKISRSALEDVDKTDNQWKHVPLPYLHSSAPRAERKLLKLFKEKKENSGTDLHSSSMDKNVNIFHNQTNIGHSYSEPNIGFMTHNHMSEPNTTEVRGARYSNRFSQQPKEKIGEADHGLYEKTLSRNLRSASNRMTSTEATNNRAGFKKRPPNTDTLLSMLLGREK